MGKRKKRANLKVRMRFELAAQFSATLDLRIQTAIAMRLVVTLISLLLALTAAR